MSFFQKISSSHKFYNESAGKWPLKQTHTRPSGSPIKFKALPLSSEKWCKQKSQVQILTAVQLTQELICHNKAITGPHHCRTERERDSSAVLPTSLITPFRHKTGLSTCTKQTSLALLSTHLALQSESLQFPGKPAVWYLSVAVFIGAFRLKQVRDSVFVLSFGCHVYLFLYF